MKQIILILITLLTFSWQIIAQEISGPKISFQHGDITLYADEDTCSLVSVHKIDSLEVLRLDDGRSNKWHNEKLTGPYKKQCYLNSGYDLGHLTPSHITSYNDTLNYNSFSMMNQAPQLAAFNRGKWSKLEGNVVDSIIKLGGSATVITGVIYDNKNKTYLSGCRIKIPIAWFKILFIRNKTYAWVGSNINGLVTVTSLKNINKMLRMNGNKLVIGSK